MYNKLKSSRLQAMKDKNEIAKSFLSTLLGAVDTEAKKPNAVDKEVLVEQIAKSMKKNILENIETYTERGLDISKEKAELALAEQFLPQVLSEEETREVVSQAITDAGITSIREQGKVMPVLKKTYGNSINMKLVSQIVQEILQ